MHNISATDGANVIDWGKTSTDYSTWRPNYPDRFFELLSAFGVGSPKQRILDLGTGTGFLALRFAGQGAVVTGLDVAENQIDEARRQATALGLDVDFRVAPAEDSGLAANSVDVVTASQSWLYFDKKRIIPEVKRLLRSDGLLLTCHFCWLPRQDAIARASEELVLRYNPHWTAADWSGDVPMIPSWSAADFRLRAMFVFDEPIPFTRESWRGRIRACRGIGASLNLESVEAFDRDHERLLQEITDERFTILHRIDAHLFEPLRY